MDCGANPDEQVPPVCWAAVYDSERVNLVRYATFLVGPSSADDVVSIAIIQILDRNPQGVGNAAGYLYRSVSNAAKNYKRAATHRTDYEGRLPAPAASEIPEVRPEVARAVRSLSQQQREVLFLVHWLGMSHAEAADWLGVAKGTVSTQLKRAYKKLRGVL